LIKKRNWFSLILAFVMLVGAIPLAVMPVSAANGDYLQMSLVDPISNATNGLDAGYDITGSTVEIKLVSTAGTTIVSWDKQDQVNPETASVWVQVPTTPTVAPGTGQIVRVRGVWGETIITATLSDGSAVSIGKKWGQLLYTVISGPQSTYVEWFEGMVPGRPALKKTYWAEATVTDMVYADFINKDHGHYNLPYGLAAQGMIFNWYLLHGTPAELSIPMYEAESGVLNSALLDLIDPLKLDKAAKFVKFANGATFIQTVSDNNGSSTVTVTTNGEEAVTIVVVPQYPTGIQLKTKVEVTTLNFWTREMEKVPQVRWAGEKIVLEKNWGPLYVGQLVAFSLENQSPGALEALSMPAGPQLPSGFHNDSQRVWTRVQPNGLASALLVCEDMGEVDVDCAIYGERPILPPPTSGDPEMEYFIENQHGFVVYYLKLESLDLMNVVGKRDGHNEGKWTPSNPWDATVDPFDDDNDPTTPPINLGLNVLEESLNVSADTLLRARVKGWFTNANPSAREEKLIDIDGNGTKDLLLPRGRWVLPDDWPALAGPNWEQDRLHWDIMDNPALLDSIDPLGPYNTGATQDVIGPFSPGIERMTPYGWDVAFTSPDPLRPYRTVVPDGELESWDAPMPPAKVIFEILSEPFPAPYPGAEEIGNAGFFKEAFKQDIYYINDIEYTLPFYQEMIPAHEAIPAFINNGGYDWKSFDPTYGPYEFWKIINRPDFAAGARVQSADPGGHPTKVEVYSDNHGEAMVYLNGDWNLNLDGWEVNAAADVPNGATVGATTVQAMADYPYLRKHQPILSNKVHKIWLWNGLILGTDAHVFPDNTVGKPSVQTPSLAINSTGIISQERGTWPNEEAISDKKVAWLFIRDRDGMPDGVLGANVKWTITGASGFNSVYISAATGRLSTYNETMENIFLGPAGSEGFLLNTQGKSTSPTSGTSKTRLLNAPYEYDLFNKMYPDATYPDPLIAPENFVVAAIEIQSSAAAEIVKVQMEITSPDFATATGTPTLTRSANVDFSAWYSEDDSVNNGDANGDDVVNMGDVTAAEMGILGLSTKSASADANGDGVYDMADIIKIERMILGLP